MRILVTEDDVALARYISKGLHAQQYVVDVANKGSEAQALVSAHEYSLLVLDLNLPDMDGVQLLKDVRQRKNDVPILILTSRNAVDDRVSCLDAGADDYLLKPFSFRELTARIRALLRRRTKLAESVLRVADLELDRIQRKVRRDGRDVELTQKEFMLLEYLMLNAGRRVTRHMIVENVWNLAFDTMTNVVDVYINYLRKKIDNGSSPKLLHTIRGVGYQLGRCED
jgi:DNA-binding response OmpR family regulator